MRGGLAVVQPAKPNALTRRPPAGRYHGGSWKRLVAERTLQDTLERLDPESFDDDELRTLLQAVAPVVCARARDTSFSSCTAATATPCLTCSLHPQVLRLHLRELKRGEPFVIPDHPADTYVPDPENWDHLDFVFVLRHLPGLQVHVVVDRAD